MTSFDVSIAIAFALLVVLLGLSFGKKEGSVSSFFAAGGAVPWWISGLSLFMSFFSVGTFVVWGSIAYKTGLVAVTIQTTMSLAGLAVGYFIAPKWNRTNVLTAAEFISTKLGHASQKFYTYLFFIISIFSGGAFLYPVGKMIEVTTGIPLVSAILFLGVVIIAYTAVGGLWAVLVTDVLQFIVLMAAVSIIVPLAFEEIGGVGMFIAKAPSDFFQMTNAEYDWLFMAAFGFYNMVFIGGSWAYVQRYTSVKSENDAKKVGYLFGVLYLIAPIIWMLPPMVYRIISPDIASTDAEGAYLQISKLVVPNGLMGLILGAMVFATASSVNTTLNIAAGVFTNDIYPQIKRKRFAFETMWVARTSTVFFGILSILVALCVSSMGGIVEVAFSLAAITGVALFLPPVWTLFSDNQTQISVISTSVISLSVNVAFKFFIPELLGVSLDRSSEMFVGVVVPIVLLIIWELYYRFIFTTQNSAGNKRPAQSERSSPSNVESSAAAIQLKDLRPSANDDNEHGKKIIAIGIGGIGLIIFGLGLQADKGQNTILLVGAFLLVLCITVFPKKTFNQRKDTRA
ncbi:sodium:solute symporter family protein [Alteromonas stellipolaris]|uniref:sodium:solute symporter family protein n=1 Tax=Alteromonas stellipolaris TaxID=233316 RepID=UPI0027352828|nr:sodium:solute symporter family protein [Alteromonas stellipolaris]MDP2537106.1 sodium:solute symporter family protein [Alteromonas stellipolaris]